MAYVPAPEPDEVAILIGFNKTAIIISGVTTQEQLVDVFDRLKAATVEAVAGPAAPDAHLEAAYEDAQSGTSDAIDFDHGFNDY